MLTITVIATRPGYVNGLPSKSPKWCDERTSWLWAQAYVEEHFKYSGNFNNKIRVDYPGGTCFVRRRT